MAVREQLAGARWRRTARQSWVTLAAILGTVTIVMLLASFPVAPTAQSADLDSIGIEALQQSGFKYVSASKEDSLSLPSSRFRAPKRDIVRPPPGPTYEIQRAAGEIVREFREAPFGIPWSEWKREEPLVQCQPFRGSSERPFFLDYWLSRCEKPAPFGNYRFSAYFVDADGPPRVGRIEWGVGPAAGFSSVRVAIITRALSDSLQQRFVADGLGSADSHRHARGARVQPLVQYTWAEGQALVYNWPSSDGGAPDSVSVVYYGSAFLDAICDSTWMPLNEHRYSDVTRLPDLQAEVIAAIRIARPALAAILERQEFFERDTTEVLQALASAGAKRTSPTLRDELTLAAHLWLRMLEGSGDARSDRSAIRRLQQAFGPYGARFQTTHYSEFCYDGGVARSLWKRPCDNRATALAFLEAQSLGWIDYCQGCSVGGDWNMDLFRPVIERGEALLKVCPKTSIRWDVLLAMAEAHETAWSLAKADPSDPYIDWKDYVLAAPDHRTRALDLYRRILTDGPARLRSPWIRGRVRRLELDVDTNYRRYWCNDD